MRLGVLLVLLMLVVLVVLDAPSRMLTQLTYALERGRIRAKREELSRLDKNLADLSEVSHAFRIVAQVATPGVVHIQATADEDALRRLDELAEQERVLRERLGAIASQMQQGSDKDEDDALLESMIDLRGQLAEIRGAHERQAALTQPVTGSGIVYDEGGYILTNNHVIGERKNILVRTPDNREYAAGLIGADPNTDLAIIKINADEMHPLEFGDSDSVRVGDWVVAVGAPFGLSHTVTHGIISATGRKDVADLAVRGVVYQNFLQTDAAINPGNSGGPLLNLHGQVVGVNTAIATRGESYNAGIAFTIPSNMASKIAEQLKHTGEVARGWLGVSMYNLSPAERKILGVEGAGGVMVEAVIEQSPADRAGLMVEDVIVAVNGRPAADMADLRGLIADVQPGENTLFEIVRGGKPATISVDLGRRPDSREITAAVPRRVMLEIDSLGVYARTLMPEFAPVLGYQAGRRGVLVLGQIDEQIEDPLIENRALIVECDGAAVECAGELLRVLAEQQTGDRVELTVLNPEGERRTIRPQLK